MHAAGEAGVVGADELLHFQGDEVGIVAPGDHLLGELAHVRLQVRDVLGRGRHDGGALDAALAVDVQDVEQRPARGLGESHATTGAHLERHRLA